MSPLLSVLAVVIGLAALVWSADRFVDGAASTARLLGVQPLLVGMVVIGFGTSAPELTVSAISALQGNPAIALGNAYGSNICNIALILGTTAALAPVVVRRSATRREIPPLLLATLFSAWLLRDGTISRGESLALLGLFALLMSFSVLAARREASAAATAGNPASAAPVSRDRPLTAAIKVVFGLVVLVASSRVLVWGAVRLASAIGVSDLIVGLTVVAVGTSLPELASSVAAARKGEDDLAVGNIIGSNVFNTLAVVGLAGAIRPMKDIDPEVLVRDLPVTFVLTALLLVLGRSRRRGGISSDGRLSRNAGRFLLLAYAAYLVWIVRCELPA